MESDKPRPDGAAGPKPARGELRCLAHRTNKLTAALLALGLVGLGFALLELKGRHGWLFAALMVQCAAMMAIAMFIETWRQLITAIDVARSPSSMGPLATLFQPYFNDPAGRRNRQVAGALAAILPNVTAEEMRALSGREARLLYRRIVPALAAREPFFALALVRSLARTLDTRALPHIEAAARPATLARFAPELADAIRACLPQLLAQRERERQGETLLRPATPSDDADMLLHAARHPADEPAELLLRATEEKRMDGGVE